MEKKALGTVYQTMDFDAFKIITGNRKAIAKRVQKIERSVKKVGYIPAPIIVNENMEIIDGQARYTYCSEAREPISYFVIEGLTVDDCIAMNISATNWDTRDYVSSYADRGYPSYVLAERFLNETKYSLKAALWALARTDASNLSEKIMNGTFNITQEDYKQAKILEAFWSRFDDIPTNRRNDFLVAIGYCYLLPSVDNETLVRKLHQRPRDFMQIANITDAIDVIEDSYNVRARTHVYIETDYFKYLDDISRGLSSGIKARRNPEARTI